MEQVGERADFTFHFVQKIDRLLHAIVDSGAAISTPSELSWNG